MKTHISTPMDASQFTWEPSMEGEVCAITVTHKFTKRTWRREFAEEEWPAVRESLLAEIERDLSTPVQEAST